jgi:hypothetical protein
MEDAGIKESGATEAVFLFQRSFQALPVIRMRVENPVSWYQEVAL